MIRCEQRNWVSKSDGLRKWQESAIDRYRPTEEFSVSVTPRPPSLPARIAAQFSSTLVTHVVIAIRDWDVLRAFQFRQGILTVWNSAIRCANFALPSRAARRKPNGQRFQVRYGPHIPRCALSMGRSTGGASRDFGNPTNFIDGERRLGHVDVTHLGDVRPSSGKVLCGDCSS